MVGRYDGSAADDSRAGVTPRVHPHASVALYLGGSATVWCGAKYTLTTGDVLVVPEGMPHYAVEWGDPKVLGLAVCTSCLTTPGAQALAQVVAEVSDGASAQRVLDPAAAARLAWVLEALEDELGDERPHKTLAIDGYLAVIGAILLRTAPVQADGGGATVSARAMSYVARYAADGISLSDVARHVGRSAAHTATVVKKDTGRTVVAWITHARLARARELLRLTDETVEAIADRVGFSSASHFHRTFRRALKTTPAAWRKAHRGSSAEEGE